jgi:hypothetical protein
MEAILKTVALGAAALLAVAVLAACWEQWFRRIQAPQPTLPEPQRAVSVDLDVDKLPDAPPPTDLHTRRATLGAAMDSMSRPPADMAATTPLKGPWIETRPMVLTSAKAETEPH